MKLDVFHSTEVNQPQHVRAVIIQRVTVYIFQFKINARNL